MTEENGAALDVEVGPSSFRAKLNSRWWSTIDKFRGYKVEIKGRADALLVQRHRNDLEREQFVHDAGLSVERAKLNQQLKVLDSVGDAAAEALKSDPAQLEDFVRRYLPEIAQRRENVNAALDSAADQLRALPLPTDLDVRGSPDQLDDDWLNFWSSYAEKASTENMRRLWGRILAGEIQREGSFSRTTLRIAAELDTETARMFQEHARYEIFESFLGPVNGSDDEDISPLTELEASGLVSGSSGSIWKTPYSDVPGKFEFERGDWLIECEFNNPTQTAIQVPCYPLTRSGKQMASLVPIDGEATLRSFAARFGQEFARMELFSKKDGVIQRPGIVLKERPVPEPQPEIRLDGSTDDQNAL
ncbi:DUF2806 domain-containing protein [Mesorhizobium sp. ES1-1]|uniref:DUF2806 domain-containing protein n=1 Tax=Mesorhizobium sp. ES1-1 TaxID=2876629 RepID=UPI001CCEC887|nr:DUF2806 domain-containing protein [Mesorhizobium sp. ES1-1]MBZ9678904.1 DUF2806 domain-containing protein [Mesorhizobium sp. ES1-1]